MGSLDSHLTGKIALKDGWTAKAMALQHEACRCILPRAAGACPPAAKLPQKLKKRDLGWGAGNKII